MKAAVFTRYGGPEVLQVTEVPKPSPGPDEVLVRVHASVATPPDCAFRSADPFIVRLFFGLTKPKYTIIGSALAGEVVAVGEAVTRFKPGDRVYGSSDKDFGTCAEFKCLPADGSLAIMPANAGFGEAVAISEGFLTAMPFIRDEGQLRAGQSILINGASGSVGSVAVQLAKLAGAEVTGVCSARNASLVRSLGADHVVDYAVEDFTAARGAYDVIFDAVGKSSFRRSREALKPGGIYLTTVPGWGVMLAMLRKSHAGGKRAKLATTGLRPASDKVQDLELLRELVEAGKLQIVIDRSYPLERIADAHRYVETGHKIGSVVIDVPGASG